MTPKPRPKLVGCLLIALLGLLWPISHLRILTTLHCFPEPAEIKHPDYKDFGSYTLHVVDRSLWWKFWERNRVCEIRIVRGNDDPDSYGHYTGYEFHNYDSAPDYFVRCTCDWEPHGVTLSEPTGHKLFIPAKAFTGGR